MLNISNARKGSNYPLKGFLTTQFRFWQLKQHVSLIHLIGSEFKGNS